MERHYGWVIVAVGALMTCVSMGSLFSLAVFLEPMALETGWPRAGIAAAMTIGFLAFGLGAFGWGAVSDRHGPRIVGVAGALLLGAGLALASRAETLLGFQLAYGLLIGAAAGAFFAPMMALASAWFDRNRGLAVSLVSAGLGMAPVTVAPVAQWLVTEHGWRTAQLSIGIAALALLLPAALLLRRPPLLTMQAPTHPARRPRRVASPRARRSARGSSWFSPPPSWPAARRIRGRSSTSWATRPSAASLPWPRSASTGCRGWRGSAGGWRWACWPTGTARSWC